jgi:hypothetical protein
MTGLIRVLKIAVLALFFIGVLYFIYTRSVESNGVFVIAAEDIKDDNIRGGDEFKKDSRIYFKYFNKTGSLNGSLLSLKIEKFDNNGYHHYKQITYEIEKGYRDIDGYLPASYFTAAGKYRIKVNLDGTTVKKIEFAIE